MVTIGWLADKSGVLGGAEVSGREFAKAKPDNVNIIYCPPDRRPPDVDLFIVQNCVMYRAQWIDELKRRPVVKHIHDLWPVGDPRLRRWLLDNAALLLFNDPLQRSMFHYQYNALWDYMAIPVDITRFRQVAYATNERQGYVWHGRVSSTKGVNSLVDWALRTNTPVDIYGQDDGYTARYIVEPVRYKGPLNPQLMPDMLARYKSYWHKPYNSNLYCRSVIEAWAADLELELHGDRKAFYNYFDPEKCQIAAKDFWDKVLSLVKE